MKKIILLLTVAFLGLSCSDDDDDDTGNNPDLIGTWKLVSITVDGALELSNECISQNTLIFTATSVTVISFTYDLDDGECTDDGTTNSNYTSTSTSIRVGSNDSSTYEINDDQLTLTSVEEYEGDDGEIVETTGEFLYERQ